MFKLAMIAGAMALTVGAYAADKPAAAARIDMEADRTPAAETEVVVHTQNVDRGVRHEAVDVGFTGQTTPAYYNDQKYQNYGTYNAPRGGTGKPAADFRVEQGR